MALPKQGMYYDDVKRRIKRMVHTDKEGKVKNRPLMNNITNSLLNQARLAEGEGAVKELQREVNDKCTSPRMGWNHKLEASWERIFK